MSKIIFVTFLFISSVSLAQYSSDAATPEIYKHDTIVWFGADFSQFNLCNSKKVGQDDKLYVYIQAWKEQYDNLSNTKLAYLLKREKVIDDKAYTDKAYRLLESERWIYNTDEKPKLTPSDLQDLIQEYESEEVDGIGLVYVIESFFKGRPTSVNGYFVWFDIETKEILHIYNSVGTPSNSYYNSWGLEINWDDSLPVSKGMTGYWYHGMLDATLNFTIDFKTAIPRKERQY